MRFLDTNVVLYTVSPVMAERHKRDLARELLKESDLCLSTQVLGEFYTQATRPGGTAAMTREGASVRIESLRRFLIQPVTEPIVVAAVETCARYQISYWDAAIIEAARTIGADTVLSEDLNDGQDYGGIRVVNPFR